MATNAHPTMTPRGRQLLGAMRLNLQHLVELEKTAPGDVLTIVQALVHHLRAWKPLELGGVPAAVPLGLQAPPDPSPIPMEHPATDVVRAICGEGRYRIGTENGLLYLVLSDGADQVAGVMDAKHVEGLREDLLQQLAEVIR